MAELFERFYPLIDTFAKLSSISGGQEDRLQLQNLALRNAKLARDLQEPTAYQQKQEEQEVERVKLLYSDFVALGKDPKTSPAVRDTIYGLLEQHSFRLPPDMRAIAMTVLKNTPLDENQKKLKFFEDHYGHLRPEKPMSPLTGSGKAGDPWKIAPAPINEDTEMAWAEYMLRAGDFNYQKDLFMLGKEAMAGREPPKYVQLLQREPEKVGDKMVEPPQKFWYIDRKTDQVMWTSVPLSNKERNKILDWGITEHYMLENDIVPTSSPMSGSFQGSSFRLIKGHKMSDGSPTYKLDTYGNQVPNVEKAKPVLSALAELAAPKGDLKDINNPIVRRTAMQLKEYQDQVKTTEDLPMMEQAANNFIQTQFPGLPFKLKYFPSEKDKSFWAGVPFFGKSNLLSIDGSGWGMIPFTNTITFNDGTTIYEDRTSNTRSDAIGRDVTTETEGATDGDPLPPGLQTIPTSAGTSPAVEIETGATEADLTVGELISKFGRDFVSELFRDPGSTEAANKVARAYAEKVDLSDPGASFEESLAQLQSIWEGVQKIKGRFEGPPRKKGPSRTLLNVKVPGTSHLRGEE